MFTPKRIDLHLPNSWRQASTEELEIIARIMMDETQRVSVYRPFDLQSVKVAVFLLLSGLEICSGLVPAVEVENQYYWCRKITDRKAWLKRWWRKITGGDDGRFELYLYQISAICEKELKWLERPSDVVRFPYPKLKRNGVRFVAPSALMQDFSWQRYRFATDFMGGYIQASNRLIRMKKSAVAYSLSDYKKQERMVENYRAMFLATLFNRKVKKVDDETHLVVNDYAYTANQSVDNMKFFKSFPDERFQVILFWWGGIHLWLQKKYPHCFKKTNVKSAPANPLELYTRTTATMEKYLGMNERDVNRELYTVVFQHLEDMAKEAEEMDKIRNKNK